MGALNTHRLTTAPLALALLLALASSTTSGGHSTAGAGATPTQPEQSAASVTTESDLSAAAAALGAATPQPAIRVAATGDLANPITRVQVPNVLLAAYRSAVAGSPDSCNLPVSLLAAIGEVESGSLVGRELDSRHRTSILGPVLDGNGFAAVPDSDGGKWDGDSSWDRAMGPMQFIPGTWRTFGVDGDGDGVADPQDVEDAAAATAAYLCYGGRDLSRAADLGSAVLAYNHSTSYQQLVLTYQRRYASLGLDDGASVSGLSSPVSLVTMQSLGSVAGSPTIGTIRTGKAGGSKGTRPAGHHATDPTKPTKTTKATKATKATKPPVTDQPAAEPAPTTPASSPSTTPAPSGSPSGTPTGTPTTSPSTTPVTPTSPTTPSSPSSPTNPSTPSSPASPTSPSTPTSPSSPTSPSGSPTTTPIPLNPENGCPLVADPDGATFGGGQPCVPCLPTTDPSQTTLSSDGREVPCVLEESDD